MQLINVHRYCETIPSWMLFIPWALCSPPLYQPVYSEGWLLMFCSWQLNEKLFSSQDHGMIYCYLGLLYVNSRIFPKPRINFEIKITIKHNFFTSWKKKSSMWHFTSVRHIIRHNSIRQKFRKQLHSLLGLFPLFIAWHITPHSLFLLFQPIGLELRLLPWQSRRCLAVGDASSKSATGRSVGTCYLWKGLNEREEERFEH